MSPIVTVGEILNFCGPLLINIKSLVSVPSVVPKDIDKG